MKNTTEGKAIMGLHKTGEKGFVEGGRLRVRVHNVLRNSISGESAYAPHDADAFARALK